MYYNHGIYIGARFSLSSEDDIVWWAQENQIDVKRENLHVTVFSAAYPGGYYDPPPFKSIRIPECKVIKSGPNKNFVVLAFEAPELVDRHFFAKKTLVSNYPFPGYTPHVTVSFNEPRPVSEFTVPEFSLLLDEEYIEPYKSDWKPK